MISLFLVFLAVVSASTCEKRQNPIDVYFMVDGSGSITNLDRNGEFAWRWKAELSFVNKLLKHSLTVEGDRAGVVQFSSTDKTQTHFTLMQPMSEMRDHVMNIEYQFGSTHTSTALEHIIEQFDNDSKMTDGRDRVLLLITDGTPSSGYDTCLSSTQYVDPVVSAKFGKTFVELLADRDIDMAIVAVDVGSGLAPVVKNLGCLVEDKDENIVQISNFASFEDYRDPTGTKKLLCIEPEQLKHNPAELTSMPTPEPTVASPTPKPTVATPKPTPTPTNNPTAQPTSEPTDAPTNKPTNAPTAQPTSEPTNAPTNKPTSAPTAQPTPAPTNSPTSQPSSDPTAAPTPKPTLGGKCEKRTQPMDVYFLIDDSGSVDATEWKSQLEFVDALLKHSINVDGDRVGIIAFGTVARKHFTFSTPIANIRGDGLMNISRMNGSTNTKAGVQGILDTWSQETDKQDGRQKLLVIVTDGQGNVCSNGSSVQGTALKNMSVDTVIVTIGSSGHSAGQSLKCLVDDEVENITQIDNFGDFTQYRDPTGDKKLLCIEPKDIPAPTKKSACIVINNCVIKGGVKVVGWPNAGGKVVTNTACECAEICEKAGGMEAKFNTRRGQCKCWKSSNEIILKDAPYDANAIHGGNAGGETQCVQVGRSTAKQVREQ